jgi:hypothetical protein
MQPQVVKESVMIVATHNEGTTLLELFLIHVMMTK